MIRLRVTPRSWLAMVIMHVDFLIVDTLNNAYNVILGKTSLNKSEAIISTLHLLMKFLMTNEINQVAPRRCYMANL